MKQIIVIQSGKIVDKKNPGVVVYEVLRLIKGVPLFFNSHFNRLQRSLELVGKEIEINKNDLFVHLAELGKLHQTQFGNIMVKVSFFKEKYIVSADLIPFNYPSREMYVNGVEVGLLNACRLNPEAKVENRKIREMANELITHSGVYEVLLVNDQQRIAEGSRSNFLGIKDNCIYTSPLDKVLQGITLLKTLQIAKMKGISVCFESISANSINTFDALFLTGTSPKILPISKVEKNFFKPNHPILKELMDGYDLLIEEDIKRGIQN